MTSAPQESNSTGDHVELPYHLVAALAPPRSTLRPFLLTSAITRTDSKEKSFTITVIHTSSLLLHILYDTKLTYILILPSPITSAATASASRSLFVSCSDGKIYRWSIPSEKEKHWQRRRQAVQSLRSPQSLIARHVSPGVADGAAAMALSDGVDGDDDDESMSSSQSTTGCRKRRLDDNKHSQPPSPARALLVTLTAHSVIESTFVPASARLFALSSSLTLATSDAQSTLITDDDKILPFDSAPAMPPVTAARAMPSLPLPLLSHIFGLAAANDIVSRQSRSHCIVTGHSNGEIRATVAEVPTGNAQSFAATCAQSNLAIISLLYIPFTNGQTVAAALIAVAVNGAYQLWRMTSSNTVLSTRGFIRCADGETEEITLTNPNTVTYDSCHYHNNQLIVLFNQRLFTASVSDWCSEGTVPVTVLARSVFLSFPVLAVSVSPLTAIAGSGQILTFTDYPVPSPSLSVSDSVSGLYRRSVTDDKKRLEHYLNAIESLERLKTECRVRDSHFDVLLSAINTVILTKKLIDQHSDGDGSQSPLSLAVSSMPVLSCMPFAPVQLTLTNRAPFALLTPQSLSSLVVEYQLVYLPNATKNVKKSFSFPFASSALKSGDSVNVIIKIPVVDEPLKYSVRGRVSIHYVIDSVLDTDNDDYDGMFCAYDRQSMTVSMLAVGTFTLFGEQWNKQSSQSVNALTLNTATLGKLPFIQSALPVEPSLSASSALQKESVLNSGDGYNGVASMRVVFLSALHRLPVDAIVPTIASSIVATFTAPNRASTGGATAVSFPHQGSTVQLRADAIPLPAAAFNQKADLALPTLLYQSASASVMEIAVVSHRLASQLQLLMRKTMPVKMPNKRIQSIIDNYLTALRKMTTAGASEDSEARLIKGVRRSALPPSDCFALMHDDHLIPHSQLWCQSQTDIRAMLSEWKALKRSGDSLSDRERATKEAVITARTLTVYRKLRVNTTAAMSAASPTTLKDLLTSSHIVI